MLIKIRDLKKVFRTNGKKVKVLKGISFDVEAGEFVSIMGPSGSGKTTLSSILACLMPSSKGKYYFRGKNVGKMSSSQLARLRNREIGFVFQDSLLLEGLSVLENLTLPLLYQKVGRKEALKRAQTALEKVGLPEKLKVMPKTLSGGQKQRVAIARALMTQPQVIFADEPCAALDPESRLDVLKIFQDLNAEGVTIVMVSHSESDASFSKRILRIENGFLGDDTIVGSQQISVGGRLSFLAQQKKDKTIFGLQKANNLKAEHIVPYVEILSQTASEQNLDQVKKILDVFGRSEVLAPILFKLEGFLKNPLLADDFFHLIKSFAHHKSWQVRLVTTGYLARLIDIVDEKNRRKILETFVANYQDKVDGIRYLCFLAFRDRPQYFNEVSYQNLLEQALLDRDSRIRATVADAAVSLPRKEFFDILGHLFSDRDPRVQANALETAWDFVESRYRREKQAEFVNEQAIGLRSENNRVKANTAIMAYGFLKPQAEKAIKELLHHENPSYVASGIYAATKVAPHLIQADLPRLLSSSYQRVHEALKSFYQPNSKPVKEAV